MLYCQQAVAEECQSTSIFFIRIITKNEALKLFVSSKVNLMPKNSKNG